MIRLVISDMDGTIIGRNEQVPAEAAEFISNLEAHGILIYHRNRALGRIICNPKSSRWGFAIRISQQMVRQL